MPAPIGAEAGSEPPACVVDGPPLELHGWIGPEEARTYRHVPFVVPPGTTCLEVSYSWSDRREGAPTNQADTVLDLGLWDARGIRSAAGFRGWSGDRHPHVYLRADGAERGYRPGPLGPGVWHAELGVGAVGRGGADWVVRVRASAEPTGPAVTFDPVDPGHVARREERWYHGDFHMHGWHSNPAGPTHQEMVEIARETKLDFLPVTEYVTDAHWGELGSVQRANPDLLVWPGREIITYFGHVNVIGETPGFVEYRHGFEGVSIRSAQDAAVAAGALFQVNHPTAFAAPELERLCRGCAFRLGDQVDWDRVDTIEVLNGPILWGVPDLRMGDRDGFENPFVASALELWDGLLRRGHRVVAVSGTDAKKGIGLGWSATAVRAVELSRAGLTQAIRAGKAYVRTRGVARSPELDLAVTGPGGERGTFGSVLPVPTATLEVTVRRGSGQHLRVLRDGLVVEVVPVTGDPFTHRTEVTRGPDRSGGASAPWTYYRVETFEARCRTAIANPVFLTG